MLIITEDDEQNKNNKISQTNFRLDKRHLESKINKRTKLSLWSKVFFWKKDEEKKCYAQLSMLEMTVDRPSCQARNWKKNILVYLSVKFNLRHFGNTGMERYKAIFEAKQEWIAVAHHSRKEMIARLLEVNFFRNILLFIHKY